MRILLDTGVLYHPRALDALVEDPRFSVLPAIALAERIRQIRRDGRDPEDLLELLEANRILIESFQKREAFAGVLMLDDTAWARLARDAMIAAHLRDGDVLWTTNPRDFLALGVARDRIVRVPLT